MTRIKMTKGKFALVDDEDVEKVSRFKWYTLEKDGLFYGNSTVYIPVRKKKLYQMHRVIMNAPKGLQVDHINGDRLDNRRSNLRLCTQSQNASNRGKNKNNTSGYKGVSWNKREKKWSARIRVNGKLYFLGNFIDIKYAAQAYNIAAKKYHKQFANGNRE